ncbi:MAG: non-homologous end-joining DNA ligase [Candidatus Eremiobacteraeota bacterium]|nr:non-homologous end-joining DNA ligase [Candidatus Eremiobacteraeota bacterium]MBV8222731.1 non-homologous end-joining DNA ligase [Candidatus Eremiobacteraeota bacterium]
MADKIPVIKQPMLPTLVDAPFDDDEWLFEVKWDGIRAICTIRASGAYELISRNHLSLNAKFPELDGLNRDFKGAPLVIDGEIVSLDAKGRSSFQRLQRRFKSGSGGSSSGGHIVYSVFDLLYDGSHDLRSAPLEQRKAALQRSIKPNAKLVILSKHIIGAGKRLFAEARRQTLEGIVAKRRDSTYQERRSRDWLKIKTHLEQEFVVAGWTDPQGSRKEFGALLLGVYERGALAFCGAVGTGFDGATLREVKAKLKPLASERCPFEPPPPPIVARTAHWVRPKLVAEIKFGEWTSDGQLRQPVFLGLRTDKDAKDVVHERPVER